jgi:hypothetical protein
MNPAVGNCVYRCGGRLETASIGTKPAYAGWESSAYPAVGNRVYRNETRVGGFKNFESAQADLDCVGAISNRQRIGRLETASTGMKPACAGWGIGITLLRRMPYSLRHGYANAPTNGGSMVNLRQPCINYFSSVFSRDMF